MENKNYDFKEIYSVHLEESEDPPFFMGELIPRSKNRNENKYFGRTFITYDGTYTYTIGRNRNEIERKSTELARYTLTRLPDALEKARMFMIGDAPPLTSYN
ncbi:hypothetical protein [Anaerophaga thermohalophila]|jgi:hypothetical protein|uniref:hypothetical protein n=1 Tax=Anaerophaga thermohalophila TaxID=177400 RepID=UPI0003788B75|nr:hypothetical protein [Anaerophaga thermohalophila]